MKHIFAIAAVFLAGTAAAQDFDQTCNTNGYVITVKSGPFSASPLYLGKSCDAFHQDHGTGRWCWHNGGVSVQMSSNDWSFRRLELYCEAPGLDLADCGC